MKISDTRIIDDFVFGYCRRTMGFIDGKYLDQFWLKFLEEQHKLGNTVPIEMIDYYYREKSLYE